MRSSSHTNPPNASPKRKRKGKHHKTMPLSSSSNRTPTDCQETSRTALMNDFTNSASQSHREFSLGRKTRVRTSIDNGFEASTASYISTSTMHSSNFSVNHSSVSRFAFSSAARVALSAFSYSIDSDELDVAISKLRDIDLDVQAVWVVSRPVARGNFGEGVFQHWAVKIFNEMVLVDLDFFEWNGMGSFGCAPICASWTELADFFHYFMPDEEKPNKFHKYRWKIVSSVLPDDENEFDASGEKKKRKDRRTRYDVKTLLSLLDESDREIQCDKKINDICDFLDEWSERKRSYHSVLNNCQRFAFDLFEFLVGDSYPDRVERLRKKMQSPFDRV